MSQASASCSFSPAARSSRFAEEEGKEAPVFELEDRIRRIQSIAKIIRTEVLNSQGNLSKITCAISLVVPKDPVLTSCGHLFDRLNIEQWLQQGKKCPLCRSNSNNNLTPAKVLQGLIQEWQKEEPIPTFSLFKKEDKSRANLFLELAREYIGEKNYQEALDAYSKAFLYTNRWQDYAEVPKIYEAMGQSEKALLGFLNLAQYQLEEGKVLDAINTLTHGRKISPQPLDIDALLLELELSREFSEDQIPRIRALPDPSEKKRLLLKAADSAERAGRSNLANSLREEVGISCPPFTPQIWRAPDLTKLPPYPQALKDFLAGDCPVWVGKKAGETHIVVPLFPEIAVSAEVGGVPASVEPRTLDSLERLDKAAGGTGYRHVWDQILRDIIPVDKEFRWAVMTNDFFPGTLHKGYVSQKRLVESKGYEVPNILDAATAILWEKQNPLKPLFKDGPRTYARYKENIQGDQLAYVGFYPDGLIVDNGGNGISLMGIMGLAGLRKF